MSKKHPVKSQIYTRDTRLPISYIPPRVMVSSAKGAQFGGLRVFADHTRKSTLKTNALIILTCRTAVNTWLCSRSDCSTCRSLTHLMNHDYFDYGKNPKTPNLSPMPGSRCHRVWYLWFKSVGKMLSCRCQLKIVYIVALKVRYSLLEYLYIQVPPTGYVGLSSLRLYRTVVASASFSSTFKVTMKLTLLWQRERGYCPSSSCRVPSFIL